MKLLKLTHANLNTDIYINNDVRFYHYYSEAHKSVLVVSNGGAYIPVKENVDEINRLVSQTKENKENGI